MLVVGANQRLWSPTMSVDDRPTIAAPDDDPYLWLEEIEAERALDFVEQQNTLTVAKFGNAGFARDRDILAAIYDRPDNIPYVTRRGGLLYNFWKDANNPRGIWRRTTLEEFRKASPQWETLLDMDKLAAEEGEDWILNGIETQPGTHPRAILSLSRGGSDAATLREFVIDTRSFVADGFALPEAKGGAQMVRYRYAVAFERVWRGDGDHVRIRPNRQAVAARRGRQSSAGGFRDGSRQHGGSLRYRPNRSYVEGVVCRAA
jgi:prolyl oligopeptidase PreP (S9A serine peptidase family)